MDGSTRAFFDRPLLIGNPFAPYINGTLIANNGLARNYYGVTHPSQPNYIALTSGTTAGVTSDDITTVDVPNIVDQLETKGKSWKAYMESYFAGGNTDKLAASAGGGLYSRKHNPFVSYRDVQTSPDRMNKLVDLSELDADLTSGDVSDFVWITPNQCNDMHGIGSPSDPRCTFANTKTGGVELGDQFLQEWIGKITSSPAWTGNSVIFVIWDESDFPFTEDTSGCCDSPPGNGGGHVPTIVLSHSAHAPRASNVAYNHYSALATIQQGWDLGCLGFTCDAGNVMPMADLVGPKK